MGDRANIVIDDNGSRVFLYTHWHGYELPEILRQALARKARWDDPQYLARIVFQQMIGNDKSETGFGISAVIGDNSYALLVVNCAERSVHLEDEGGEPKSAAISISDYAALPSASWESFASISSAASSAA